MMKKLLFLGLPIALLLNACTPPMYIPNTTALPVLRKQGDLHLSGSMGSNGWDVQTAVAATDKVGIMLNGSYGNSQNDTRITKHLFSELGVGYTTFLNQATVDEDDVDYVFSAFGGAGLGHAEGTVQFSNIFSSDINYNNTVSGEYLRAFAQPTIGIVAENVQFLFALRTSYVKMLQLNTDLDADWNNAYITDEEYELYSSFFERKDYNVFFEPTLTLKLGGEQAKFFAQGGLSLGQIPTVQTTFRQRPIIAIVGFEVNMNVLKKN